MPAPRKERVAVGMSGGVDSSLAAALLLEAGYEVIGLTMAIWDPDMTLSVSGRSGCYGPGEKDDIAAAEATARRLRIDHHVVSLAGEYRDKVLEPFCTAYLSGCTPNPCALCNPLMKFDLLPKKARAQGILFDRFATGHYARLQPPESGRGWRLLRGRDTRKDQSYFLARLSQEQLADVLFPLGAMTKDQVREEARRRGLQTAAGRPESQDFFEGEDRGVLFAPGTVQPGPIVDTAGRQLGTHRGLVYYTIGQREGLGIAAGKRLYVKEIIAATNTLVVAERTAALTSQCQVRDFHWIAGVPPDAHRRLGVQCRYRHAPAEVQLQPLATDRWRLDFAEPQFAVAPGQMAVLYAGDEVLGGGWIVP